MTEKEWILTHVLGCSRTTLYAEPERVTPDIVEQACALLDRRAQGDPLQYLLGETEFMGLRLRVDERVLIPRPETEFVVEEVFRRIAGLTKDFGRKRRFLDAGTGSGNIALALARRHFQADIEAWDISEEALTVARANAERAGMARRVQFLRRSFQDCGGFRDEARKFDGIVSNPPYIPTSQLSRLPRDVQKEPRVALDGGEDGLRWIRILLNRAPEALRPGGFLVLEIGDGQREAVEEEARAAGGWRDVTFVADCSGVARVFSAKLLNEDN